MKNVCLRVLCLLLAGSMLHGADYFVEKHGSDANDGKSLKTPKATISAAVKLLRPGDTLTIGPGEYYETVTGSFAEESAGKRVTIKARFPGSVLLRGDKEVTAKFKAVPGFRFVYAADFPSAPNALNERDTFKILTPAGSAAELEFSPGQFFYDAAQKKLYISTSDGASPDRHFYTASFLHRGGLHLYKASFVTLDGLMATGFYAFNRLPNGHSWGLRLNGKTDAVIKNCKAFFNSNGIHFGMRTRSVIEDSVVYANGSPAPASGGNMVVWGTCHGNTVRRCRSFFSTHPNGLGIRFYGGSITGNRIEDCVTFGESGIGVKGSIDRDPKMRNICYNNYNERQFASSYGSNNIFRTPNAYASDGGLRLDLLEKKKADFNALFADPENHDFRPQEGAKGIGQGLVDRKDVFFVSPKGDDRNSGRSLAKAWKTLKNVKPGTTVYMLPGVYDFPGHIAVDGVTLKTRGTGARAVMRNTLTVSGKRCAIDGVNFIGKKVTVSGKNAKVICCGFNAPLTVTGTNAEIAHNAFTVTPDFSRATGFRHSNLYTVKNAPGGLADLDKPHAKPEFVAPAQGDFTVKNAYLFGGRGFDAFPVGPYRLVRENNAQQVKGPFIRSVSDTTADIEWWTAAGNATSELRWGDAPNCSRRAGSPFRGDNYHSVTLTGLTPGKKYYFKVFSRIPPREFHSNMELHAADIVRERKSVTSKVHSFDTLKTKPAPRTFYVSPKGSDSAPGTLAAPFRSINAALWKAAAGDTVIVRGGTYSERVRFRSGGDMGKVLTLRSFPGEKVILDGKRVFFNLIDADCKSHITIDGFYFREVWHKHAQAALFLNGGSNVTVQRCFYDGRSLGGYTPQFINAQHIKNLLFANNVILGGFSGSTFWVCPELVMRNNVFYINSIVQTYIHCHPEHPLTMERNIFYDLIPGKYFMNMIGIYHLDALTERYNCFYPRMPAEGKGIFRVGRYEGKAVEKRLNYPDAVRMMGSKATSLTVNPMCPVLKELASFKKAPPIMHQYMTLEEKNPPDYARVCSQGPAEMHLVKGKYKELDFKDFFAQNPAVIKIGAGLQKELFHPAGGIR